MSEVILPFLNDREVAEPTERGLSAQVNRKTQTQNTQDGELLYVGQ